MHSLLLLPLLLQVEEKSFTPFSSLLSLDPIDIVTHSTKVPPLPPPSRHGGDGDDCRDDDDDWGAVLLRYSDSHGDGDDDDDGGDSKDYPHCH